jgi:hypothetical protein
MAEGIRPLAPRTVVVSEPATAPSATPAAAGVEPVPLAQRSRLGAKLAAGQFVTSVEIVPPRGVDTTRLAQDAQALATAGVDAINVPDGPRAQSRMGAIATSLIIERHGIEFPPEKIFVIGDTPRDIECGRAIGANTVAIATGHYSMEELSTHTPDFLFADFSETDRVLECLLGPSSPA